MTNFTGAVFDLDGTLIDSMGVWARIDMDFLRNRGLTMPRDYTDAVKTMGFAQAAAYTIERFSLPETPEEICREWLLMAREVYASEVRAKPYAREYLTMLRARGVKLGLATASPAALYIPALRRNGLYELFDACVSTDDVGCGKENPAVFLEAARRIGLPPADCVAFEDTLNGVRCAKAAGMRVVGVWDSHSEHDTDAIRGIADGYIMGFFELLCN